MWIHVPIRIQYSDPKLVVLEGLTSANRTLIDSAYALLSAGYDVETVLTKLSATTQELKYETFGQVDVRRYAKDIQQQLLRLGPSEYTKPLRLGEQYVIFRRMPENHTSNVR